MSKASTALVTGASSGIGFELACRAAEAGRDLVLVARDPARLALAADRIRARYAVQVVTQTADLSTDAGITLVAHTLRLAHPEIDMVMNCAGIAHGGAVHHSQATQELDVLRVNMEATLRISRSFAVDFAQHRRGALLNVASLAAFQAGPYLANYYASKAYVLSLTEGMARELAPYGVRVSVLCPGTTATPFHARAGIDGTDLAKGLFGIVMPSERVSRIAYDAWGRGQVVIVPGWVNKAAALAVRFVPRGVCAWFTGWLNRPASPWHPAPLK
jgi:short-subunit dehydrogenase